MRRFTPWLLVPVLLAACSRPLPEESSQAAALYRERCGTCHRAYAPAATTFATWEMILPRMEKWIAQSGKAPLSETERRTIRDYLRRHAG